VLVGQVGDRAFRKLHLVWTLLHAAAFHVDSAEP